MQSARSLLWQRRCTPVSFSKHQLASLVQIREQNKCFEESVRQKSQHSSVQAHLTGSLELEQADIPQLDLMTFKVFSNRTNSMIHGFTETLP